MKNQDFVLNGNKVAEKILANLQEKIKENPQILKKKLGIILIGENPASKKYVQMKKKTAEKLKIEVIVKHCQNLIETRKTIEDWNKDVQIAGYFIQLPLPKNIKNQTQNLLNLINFQKDVDGLTGKTLANLITTNEVKNTNKPATVESVLQILKYYNFEVMGKNICIVGASNLVGTPLQICLNKMGATTTLCHEFTQNLDQQLQNKDCIISAVGKKGLIKLENIQKNAFVVDVGVSVENGKIFGDVDFDEKLILQKNLKITPPTGGVGPVTVACLLRNFIENIN